MFGLGGFMVKNFAVISIKPEYVEAIIQGDKVYELRRRRPNLNKGDQLIIYQTSPDKKVTAVAEIESIIEGQLAILWEKVKKSSAVSFDEFTNYFSGCEIGYALKLKNVKKYKNPPTLEDLRSFMPKYTPPQFFHFLKEAHPLYSYLTSSI